MGIGTSRSYSWTNRFLSVLTCPCLSLLLLVPIVSAESHFLSNAEATLTTLNQWYNYTSGVWDTTGWWNSANCLTTLINVAVIDSTVLPQALTILPNTFIQAQRCSLAGIKKAPPNAVPETCYTNSWPLCPPEWPPPIPIQPSGFLNDYYDDEGWWAHAWIAAYDLTSEPTYLATAEAIFADMAVAWTTPCGGIWWDRHQTSVNAIANELFFSTAAHLANRVQDTKRQEYLDWAQRAWDWFQASGMINDEGTVNDGLTLETCTNDGGIVWSYNQGVILGGLVELNSLAPDPNLIYQAQAIANAAIANLTDADGVLHDVCEPDCGADGSQFKGIFMRNLGALQGVAPSELYEQVIRQNAESIWANDRANGAELSVVWSGPFVSPANASTQSSALDALVAAAALDTSGESRFNAMQVSPRLSRLALSAR